MAVYGLESVFAVEDTKKIWC